MEQRDLVIGAVTGYSFKHLAAWANSLDMCGFKGIKALVIYNMDGESVKELSDRGYTILGFMRDDVSGNLSYPKPQFSIVVERFLHYYLFLDSKENLNNIRYVLSTDVKDVIFQRNPSLFFDSCQALESERACSIIASSEELQYQHEPWGMNNMTQAYGKAFYERHKTNTIYNCGVVAGKFHTFMGLCKTLYLMSAGAPQYVPGGGGPDQAALNLLLDTPAYKNITLFTNHDHAWAAQLGTTMDPTKISEFSPYLQSYPRIDTDRNLIVTVTGEPYTIVHQWDRVSTVRSIVERKYL